ncbi:hypothetical protein [Lacrimispora saccharolytica]|uniref:Uncharacterized protein n=1 Tax=Lacrimispora saccharolytica (strain ATCC 35040 / DSM 2544 / NRCC 2533 / WM1) TaxID=610130 RepID=D9R1Z1_LACSW|nr:hypothetical protein [Lacrimispora saccharolytica]ADL02882.1 hypothetical protein Closa_0242 [[Clostridium] saccharolyticum WM1]QRV18918.1 hypothetical protein I6K70_15670 [Lacrimispora saccharolytica]
MDRKFNYGLYITKITVFAFGILFFPYFYFQYQDRKLLSEISELEMNVFHMDRVETNSFTLEEKLMMITESNAELMHIELKTGDRYSLYEARRQCFRELCKIPVLEASIYGPILSEINITPYLFLDSETPSSSMLIWKGFLTIKDMKYQVALEEESGKLLLIQPVGKEDAALNIQWKEYLKKP